MIYLSKDEWCQMVLKSVKDNQDGCFVFKRNIQDILIPVPKTRHGWIFRRGFLNVQI